MKLFSIVFHVKDSFKEALGGRLPRSYGTLRSSWHAVTSRFPNQSASAAGEAPLFNALFSCTGTCQLACLSNHNVLVGLLLIFNTQFHAELLLKDFAVGISCEGLFLFPNEQQIWSMESRNGQLVFLGRSVCCLLSSVTLF